MNKTIETLVREQLKEHMPYYSELTSSRSNTQKTRVSFFVRQECTLGNGRTYDAGHNECAYFFHYTQDRPSSVRIVLGKQLTSPQVIHTYAQVMDSRSKFWQILIEIEKYEHLAKDLLQTTQTVMQLNRVYESQIKSTTNTLESQIVQK
jgi:hypothetical protein